MTEPLGHPQLPDYDFERVLGRGGMGTVFLFHNRLMDRPEVVKLLAPEVLAKPGNRGRFEQEIRAAAKLNHPNIVAAYTAVRVGDSLAFCMEYVDGDDLMKVVDAEGPLPPAVAADYIAQAAGGLQHAHERRMVHRDIKPNNLMRTVDNGRTVVKVVDFGLAKLAGGPGDTHESQLTQYGQVLGTPDYIAPEQIRNTAGADIRADLYSLGCTLYFLLAGRPPFRGESLFDLFNLHINEQPPGLRHVRDDLPPGLIQVVERLMAKDPAARFQTPAEVRDALLPFAGGPAEPPSGAMRHTVGPSTTPADPPKPPPPTPSPTPPKPMPSPAERLYRPPGSHTLGPGDVDHLPAPEEESLVPVLKTADERGGPGWLVPTLIGLLLLAGVGAVGWSLLTPDEVVSPTTTPATAPAPQPKPPDPKPPEPQPKPPDPLPKPPDPLLKPPDPLPKPVPPTPTGPPDWYRTLFGTDDTPRQTVSDGGDRWRLKDGALTADPAPVDRVALFDSTTHQDLDLAAEVQVTGAAGLLVRGAGRLVGGKPTGYLIGLGGSDAPTGFAAGTVNRWGLAGGLRKEFTLTPFPNVKAGDWVRLAVRARGHEVFVRLNDLPEFKALDAEGYLGGRVGLVTKADARIAVRNLSVKPVAPADPPAVKEPEPGFTRLFAPDDLSGWEVEGEDRGWELVGNTLVGRGDRPGYWGHLLAPAEYADFVLQFDFRLAPRAVGTVSLRAAPKETVDLPLEGKPTPFPVHPGLKLLAAPGTELNRPGALERWFGSRSIRQPNVPQPAVGGVTADAWHAAEVRVEGETISVRFDEQEVVYPVRKSDPAKDDPAFPPGQRRKAGRVGLTVVAGEVQYRDVRVKPLGN